MSRRRSTGLILVQRVLRVAGEHRHPLLREDRAGVDARIDDDDARTGLADAGGERVAHPVRAGELGQVRGVGVDEGGRPGIHEVRGQQPHEAAQHDEVGGPHVDLGAQLLPPLLARLELAEGHEHGGDAEGFRVREAVGLAVGADDDDPRGEVGVRRGLEERTQVRPRSRDEDGDREHAASLPAGMCGPGRRPGQAGGSSSP